MRLALAIAFSKRAECTVIHGVVPWLDHDGKQCLLKEIETTRSEGRAVLLMEQEIDYLKNYADCVLFFDGQSLNSSAQAFDARLGEKVKRASQVVKSQFRAEGGGDSAVEFRAVDFRYDKAEQHGFHLDNLSFRLKSSRIYGLIGDNGTGKSTIANLILRLERPVRGEIYIHGRLLKVMTRKDIMEQVCYMSQFPEQQIMLSSVQQYRHKMEKRGNVISTDLLDNHFDRTKDYPLSLLTPLEMKILTLASSVSERTRIVILDEPTWGIDSEGLQTFLMFINSILHALTEPTLLIITHDYALIELVGAVVLQINKNGPVAEQI